METINIEEKGNQLYEYNLALHEIIDGEIYGKYAYFEEPDKFNYTVLFKVMTLLDTVSFLMVNLKDKRYYFNSIYLILRTCLSDIICLHYIFEKFLVREEAKERIQLIMDDHVFAIYHSADTEERALLIQSFPDCFDNGKPKKGAHKVSVKGMYYQIQSPTIKQEVEKAMKLYEFFSKLEHNGVLSFNIMHKPFTPEGYESAKTKVCEAITAIIRGIQPPLLNWLNKDDEQFKELIKLVNKLQIY